MHCKHQARKKRRGRGECVPVWAEDAAVTRDARVAGSDENGAAFDIATEVVEGGGGWWRVVVKHKRVSGK